MSQRITRQDGPGEPNGARFGKAWPFLLVLILVVIAAGLLLVRSKRLWSEDSPAKWYVPEPDIASYETRVRNYLTLTRQAVEDDPDSPRNWGEYAMALDAHMLTNDAAQAYLRATQLQPENFQWAYLYALSRYYQSTPPEAPERIVTLLEGALALDPTYAHGYVRLGDVHVSAGRLEDAKLAYEESLRHDADLVVAHRSLGQVLLTLGLPQEAVEHLNRADQLAPDDRAVATALAQGYMRLGEREKADDYASRAASNQQQIGLIDPLRRAVDDMGLSTRHSEERANRRIYEKRFPEAIIDLLIVMEKYPDDPMVHYRLGMCYERTGQITQAIVALKKALRLRENLFVAHIILARIYLRRDPSQAIDHYRQAILHADPNADLHTNLAIALANMGDIEAALIEFRLAVEIAPESPDKLGDLSRALMMTGDLPGATEQSKKALELDPEHAIANFNLGQIYEQMDRLDDAIAHYRRAVATDSNSPASGRLRELLNRPRQ